MTIEQLIYPIWPLRVGRFISQGIFESMTKYYPKQQDCAAELMQQMEHFNVIPDDDFGRRLVKIFGCLETLS